MTKLKHLGILAISAEGAALCFTEIIRITSETLGSNKHPEITLQTAPFDQILQAQASKDWSKLTEVLVDGVSKLEKTGCQLVVIPANSIHFVINEVQSRVKVKIVNLLELVKDECEEKGFQNVAILGVGLTMKEKLYDPILKTVNVEVIYPSPSDQEKLNMIIYQELVRGIKSSDSTQWIIDLLTQLKDQGAQSAILACTEIPMVIDSDSSPLPIIDTTRILAKKAVENIFNRTI